MLITIIFINGCGTKNIDNTHSNAPGEEKITVAVSIVPQETFVKAVAGDLVDVVTMIPPGHSPANYLPTPKQMTKLSEAQVYFSMDIPTEEANILPKLDDFNKELKVVSLADIVGEVYPHRHFDQGEEHEHHDVKEHEHNGVKEHRHHHGGRDPHIWLSPKRVKVMIEAINTELGQLDPDNIAVYEKKATEYLAELDEIDNEIRETLSGLDEQSFIIYHPAFGYFADDYGLKMVTIEEEGKEATSKKLQEVIDFARKEEIRFIFYQEEFHNHQAETIAKEIGGATVKVAPLAPDYIENLRYISNKFKEVLQ